MILAQISDPHVEVGPGDRGSAESLAAGVRAVAAHEPDAVLVTGDLAEHASAAEYERVRELLAPLPMPLYTLPGNHDDPGAVRAPGTVDVAGIRLVLCDSTIRGRDDGRLDVGWLETQLGDGPTIVAMHHPPFDIGVPAMDGFSLGGSDRAALAGLLERSPQVLRVICGHTHRAAFSAIGGRPAMTCPAIHLAAKLEIGSPTFQLVREPPAFALHVVSDGAVVTHIQPVSVLTP